MTSILDSTRREPSSSTMKAQRAAAWREQPSSSERYQVSGTSAAPKEAGSARRTKAEVVGL